MKKTALKSSVNQAAFDTPKPALYFKDLIREHNEQLAEQFKAKASIFSLLRARADFIDEILIQSWQHFVCTNLENFALIAVGGYGRRELQPYSDIDLLILHDAEIDSTHVAALENFLRFLWDTGLKIGHSVRTLDECEKTRHVAIR